MRHIWSELGTACTKALTCSCCDSRNSSTSGGVDMVVYQKEITQH